MSLLAFKAAGFFASRAARHQEKRWKSLRLVRECGWRGRGLNPNPESDIRDGGRSAQVMSIQESARQLDITEQTYYRWRKSYGGLRTDQAKRLKELEKENGRLKKLVAEQALEMAILKEARDFLSKNC